MKDSKIYFQGTSSNMTTRENRSSAEKKKKQGINKMKKNLQSKSEGLLLDEVLAADKEVADLYLHRFSVYSFVPFIIFFYFLYL